MAESYAKSYNISAFPISVDRTVVAYNHNGDYVLSKTDTTDTPVPGYNGKAITEHNITTLLSTFLGNDINGFVISYTHNGTDSYTQMAFMLGGYYFNVTDTDILNPQPGPLYAILNYADSTADEYKYIFGDAASSMRPADTTPTDPVYYGVKFDSEAPSEGIYLQLLDATNRIPIRSLHKFRSQDIRDINGGTV